MLKNKPLISFIIPVYNSSQYINKVVQSILNQQYPADRLEIILIDDHSKDDSLKKLQLLESNNPRSINVIAHQINKGLSSARNTGINNARGDILVFLDSDISLEQDFIPQVLKRFKDDKIKGIVGKTLPGKDVNYDKFQKYLYEARRGARNLSSCGNVPYHHFLYNITAVRKGVVMETGEFDPGITKYGGEDTEYAYRMAQKYPEGLYCCPNIKGYHHHYRSLEDAIKLYRIYGRDNVPYIINKHPSMKPIYYFDYLEGPFYKRMIGKIIKTKRCRKLLKLTFKIIPAPFYFVLVKLLLASALLEGIDSSEKI